MTGQTPWGQDCPETRKEGLHPREGQRTQQGQGAPEPLSRLGDAPMEKRDQSSRGQKWRRNSMFMCVVRCPGALLS